MYFSLKSTIFAFLAAAALISAVPLPSLRNEIIEARDDHQLAAYIPRAGCEAGCTFSPQSDQHVRARGYSKPPPKPLPPPPTPPKGPRPPRPRPPPSHSVIKPLPPIPHDSSKKKSKGARMPRDLEDAPGDLI